MASQQDNTSQGQTASGGNQTPSNGPDGTLNTAAPDPKALVDDPLKNAATLAQSTAKVDGASAAAAASAATPMIGTAAQTTVTSGQAVSGTPASAAPAVLEQVSVQVTKAVSDGVDHINIKLNPPELGRVEVRMEVGPGGHVSAVFSADRPQTAELLQRNAHELTQSLQDAGVRTDAGSLSFNLRGQNQQNNFGASSGSSHTPALASSWDDAPVDGAPLPAVYASSSSSTTRLDIRV